MVGDIKKRVENLKWFASDMGKVALGDLHRDERFIEVSQALDLDLLEKHTMEYMCKSLAHNIFQYVTADGSLLDIQVLDELKKYEFFDITIYNMLSTMTQKHNYMNTIHLTLKEDAEGDGYDDVRAVGEQFRFYIAQAQV